MQRTTSCRSQSIHLSLATASGIRCTSAACYYYRFAAKHGISVERTLLSKSPLLEVSSVDDIWRLSCRDSGLGCFSCFVCFVCIPVRIWPVARCQQAAYGFKSATIHNSGEVVSCQSLANWNGHTMFASHMRAHKKCLGTHRNGTRSYAEGWTVEG